MPILKRAGFVDDCGNIHLTRDKAARANLQYNTSKLHWAVGSGTNEQNEQLLAALETWRAERKEEG